MNVLWKTIIGVFTLGRFFPAILLLISGIIGVISVFVAPIESTTVSYLFHVPLAFLALPYVPEKIIGERMTEPLRFIYAWVVFFFGWFGAIYIGDSLYTLF